MNNLIKKYLKISGIVLGSLLLSLIVVSLILNFFFKDQLVAYVINQVNKQTDTRIDIKSADLTFWKSFPNVAVQFSDMCVQSSKTYRKVVLGGVDTDTLLNAQNVGFEFNLIQLIRKKFILKRIVISNGNIFLKTDHVFSNYEIFKSSDSSATAADLDIRELDIKNCTINYSHKGSGLAISTLADKVQIAAKINNRKSEFWVRAALFINYLNVGKDNYIKRRNFTSNLHFTIGDKQQIVFAPAPFSLSDVPFIFKGTILNKPASLINFNISGENLDLSDVFEVLPQSYQKAINNYKASGEIGFDLNIKGTTGSGQNPLVTVKYSIQNGSITEKVSNVRLGDIHLVGSYSNGKYRAMQSSYIKVNKFISKLGSGEISFNGELKNFVQPKIQLSAVTRLDLNELKQFLTLDTLSVMEGAAEGNFTVTGKLPRFKNLSLSDIKDIAYSGQVNLHKTSLQVKGSDFLISDIDGLIKIDNDIYFNQLSFSLNENRIQLSGKMINGIPYFLKQVSETSIEADLSSLSIDLSKYFTKSTSQQDGAYSRDFLFPNNLSFDLKLNVNSFKLNKFEAKWIKGSLSYKPGLFILRSLSLQSCEGRVSGNAAIMQDINNNFVVKAQSDVSKVNIRDMFFTFNNFTQKIITDENLKGKISGKINFSALWDNKLNFKPDYLSVEADVTITNGELVNFEPMYGLSKFIALDELRNVKFSTLHNTIYIKDKQIIIPKMEIQSSAFNIVGSGTHTFDNHYQYKLRVLLSEVLFNKAKKAKKENEEFGKIEDDGLGRTTIPLKIEGIGNNYKIIYDTKSTLELVKESFVKQKTELKQIFKDEFGWFKNDTVTKSSTKISNKPKVKWDDEPTADPDEEGVPNNESVNKSKSKDKEDKPRVEWE